QARCRRGARCKAGQVAGCYRLSFFSGEGQEPPHIHVEQVAAEPQPSGDVITSRVSSKVPMNRSLLSVLLAVSSLLAISCRSVPPYPICKAGEQKAVMDTLYFGTSMPEGTVTSEEWQKFLAEVITPLFPEGLTAWAAAGQWKDPNGLLQKEDSY